MTTNEHNPTEYPIAYISYNGLGRNPMIWGIPYMTGLVVVCVSLLGGLVLGVGINPFGWLFSLISIPILMSVKIICTNDDKAVEAILLDAKWVILKFMGGNAKYYGGTMTISPMTYGRKLSSNGFTLKNVKRYFKKTIGW
jgi:type IV secretion system protein VirB3